MTLKIHMPFTSLVKIMNAGSLHSDLHHIFGLECHSHLAGEVTPDIPEERWETALFSIRNQVDSTETIQPHLKWVSDLIKEQERIFTQVRDAGGKIRFIMFQFFTTPRGCQLILSEDDLKTLHDLKLEFESISVKQRAKKR